MKKSTAATLYGYLLLGLALGHRYIASNITESAIFATGSGIVFAVAQIVKELEDDN